MHVKSARNGPVNTFITPRFPASVPKGLSWTSYLGGEMVTPGQTICGGGGPLARVVSPVRKVVDSASVRDIMDDSVNGSFHVQQGQGSRSMIRKLSGVTAAIKSAKSINMKSVQM
ncbi:hypothetical protein BaRGS_00028737 [Batillaria attramentaria]|uniref:Uncharacterized protein n=1 Tax=Batillaria attramentaria TaxID=370345 RepID=A0ABD0JYD5_9CAEN